MTAAAPGFAVVVPALNESRTIERVVSSLAPFAERIYVVDDGSTDGTGNAAAGAGATVLRNDRPGGYDAAIAAGLNRAFADGAVAVCTCDADGQHRAEDVARVAHLVIGEGADLSSGLRDRYNRPVEAAIGALSRLIFGSRDPFCGLKCYSAEFHRKLDRFPDDSNVGTLPLVWVRRFGLSARFVRISVEDRADRPRFGRRFVADFKLLRAFARTVLVAAIPPTDPLRRARSRR
jgi:glycosyltransferase involved in cell wall biosynthesis